jgi:hypothetical protein
MGEIQPGKVSSQNTSIASKKIAAVHSFLVRQLCRRFIVQNRKEYRGTQEKSLTSLVG